MSGQEIGAVLLAWAQERVFELADQKWNPQTAEMTVLEGPEIPVSGLSMGRGWPTALREGQDVTARVLAEAREAIVDGSVARGRAGAGGARSRGRRRAPRRAPAPSSTQAPARRPRSPPVDRRRRAGPTSSRSASSWPRCSVPTRRACSPRGARWRPARAGSRRARASRSPNGSCRTSGADAGLSRR